MYEFHCIPCYRVNSVFMNGLHHPVCVFGETIWPKKCKHTSEHFGLPCVLCFKELQRWHHVTGLVGLSLSRMCVPKCSLSLVCKSKFAFSGTEIWYRMIWCETVLGNTDAIWSVPLKVQSSVPNPTHETRDFQPITFVDCSRTYFVYFYIKSLYFIYYSVWYTFF